jgi:mono/diheme cytochrome c family protein
MTTVFIKKPGRTGALHAVLSIFISTGFYTFSNKPLTPGKKLYTRNCKHCHGTDGTRGFLGAKNLRKSILPDSDISKQVQNGKRIMPSFRKKFSADELMQVIGYVKSLRQD